MLNQITLACYTQGHENQFINFETWSISELYCSYLKELNTGKIVKVNVNIRDKWGELISYYENYGDVVTIRSHFDFNMYRYSEKVTKKKMQLDALHDGLMRIAEKEGWNTDYLLDAYNNSIKSNLSYQFYLKGFKFSPNKNYKIGFWCNWDIDIFEVYWVLNDKKNIEILRKKFIEKPPYKGEMIYYVKWKWLNNNEVLFQDKYKYGDSEEWKISISI